MDIKDPKTGKSQATRPINETLIAPDLPRDAKVVAKVNDKDSLTSSSFGLWDNWFNEPCVSERFMASRDQPQSDTREQF